MQKRQLAALILAPLMAAACAGSGASPSATPSASSGLLAQIKASGVITAGLAVDPPMILQDSDGTWTSFSPALLRMLGDYYHIRVQIVPATWPTMVSGLLANKYDFIGADLSATAERAKAIDFSMPYANVGESYFVEAANTKNLTTTDQLNQSSITIAVGQGGADESTTRQFFPNAKINAIQSNLANVMSEVTSGRADAAGFNSWLAPFILQQYPGIRVVPAYDPSLGVLAKSNSGVGSVGIVWGLRKGNSDLAAWLNAFLQAKLADGTILKLAKDDITQANMGQ